MMVTRLGGKGSVGFKVYNVDPSTTRKKFTWRVYNEWVHAKCVVVASEYFTCNFESINFIFINSLYTPHHVLLFVTHLAADATVSNTRSNLYNCPIYVR